MLLQRCFCVVGVFHGEDAACDRKSENTRSVEQAACPQSCQRLAAEFLLFVGGDEPLPALRQAQACCFSRAQGLDEIRIHFQFRRDRKLNNLQQPRRDGCLESLRLIRTRDLLYDLFRYDERIRMQFSEQIQSANVNEIDQDVRVGYNDTNNGRTWRRHSYSGRSTGCASASSIPAFTRRSCAIHWLTPTRSANCRNFA